KAPKTTRSASAIQNIDMRSVVVSWLPARGAPERRTGHAERSTAARNDSAAGSDLLEQCGRRFRDEMRDPLGNRFAQNVPTGGALDPVPFAIVLFDEDVSVLGGEGVQLLDF